MEGRKEGRKVGGGCGSELVIVIPTGMRLMCHSENYVGWGDQFFVVEVCIIDQVEWYVVLSLHDLLHETLETVVITKHEWKWESRKVRLLGKFKADSPSMMI